MSRRLFIGGNWKMQASLAKVDTLIEILNLAHLNYTDRDIVVAPSFPFLSHVKSKLRKEIETAAQNCFSEKTGAYTGEVRILVFHGSFWVTRNGDNVSANLARYLYVSILTVAKKIGLAIEVGLHVIACIGETQDQRNSNKTEATLETQLQPMIDVIKDWSKVVIAYEPVWAIGTGVVATPSQAEEAHLFIRKLLKAKAGESVASAVRIIYGGSVKAKNVEILFKQPNIDGFLVGGASLDEEFITILNCPRS